MSTLSSGPILPRPSDIVVWRPRPTSSAAMTRDDIDNGLVNILVGLSPPKPTGT